ncbi:MAG: hypothetical protein AB2745_19555 [Candidatus Thiodiazotropha endolucinida]
MREITLPAVHTVSISIDLNDLDVEPEVMPNGTESIYIGGIAEPHIEALNMARDNGTKVLWATICLEKKLESILVNYFMGSFSGPCSKRQLFESELIQSSSFPFSLKKNLIDKLSAQVPSFQGKDRTKLQQMLKSVMSWRNAFAHGTLCADSKKGILLRYYSGGMKEDQLNDSYWNTVEDTFNRCDELVDQLSKQVKCLTNKASTTSAS